MSGEGAVSDARAKLPRPEGLSGEFFEQCARGRLCFQRCDACAAWRHLPRYLCPACGSTRWSWHASSGKGRLFSWTVTHQASHPAFADEVPYAIIVVEMEEGVRIVSRLRGLPLDELALDLPVVVEIEAHSEDYALPWFRPVETRA